MGLEDLGDQGLLLPEEHWGDNPEESWRSRAQIVVCGALFLASALLIWFGMGSWVTFVGIGVFLLDLVLFMVFTFQAVEFRVDHLLGLGVGGDVEGLLTEDESWSDHSSVRHDDSEGPA